MVKVDCYNALVVPGPHQADQHTLVLGPRLEAAIATEAATVIFVRKVDPDFRLVDDWVQGHRTLLSGATAGLSRSLRANNRADRGRSRDSRRAAACRSGSWSRFR